MGPPSSVWEKPLPYKYDSGNGFPGLKGDAKAPGAHGKAPPQASSPMKSLNYKEVQQDEVDALQAIYFEGFEEIDTRNAAWNKSADHAFKLQLRAQSDPEISVTLTVQMTATYPNTSPLLSVSGLEYLRPNFRSRINEIVVDEPKKLLGREMIHEIAEAIEEALEQAARNIIMNQEAPTLEEERASQEAEAARLAREHEEDEKRRKAEAAVEEERTMSRMVKEELHRRRTTAREVKKKRKPPIVEDEPELNIAGGASGLSFDQPIPCKDEDGNTFTFRSVHGMVKLGEGRVTTVFNVQPYVPTDLHRAPALVLKQVDVKDQSSSNEKRKSSIQDLDDELDKLKALRGRHANIVDVLDFRLDRIPSESPEGLSVWRISILTEHAKKGSLEDLLDSVAGGSLAMQTIRLWTVQLLDALEFLHCAGLIHGDLHSGNVLLCRSSAGSTTIKLADGGFQRRLHEIMDTNYSYRGTATAKSAFWLPPELAQGDAGQLTRKSDVFSFGIVFVQLLFGLDVVHKYCSPTDLLDSTDLSDSLEEFIRKIFRVDPKKRPSAFNLLPEEFLRNDAPIERPALESRHSSMSLLSPRAPRTRHDSVGTGIVLSRYVADFDEAGRLGKGGFGEVVKARNKLDNQLYAVKKISQNSTNSLTDVLSEIMLLSRLNHPNVVRYFAAWIEEETQPASDTGEETTSNTESSSSVVPRAGPSIEFGQTSRGLDFMSSSGYPNIEFGYDTGEESDESDQEVGTPPADAEGGDDEQSEKEVGGYFGLKRVRSGSRSVRPSRKTLYIQMEYCEKHTLRDLIREDLHKKDDEIWRLLRQIVEGLAHIHGHGIIHRDLKPDNIFIDVASIPRIGDFGLATSGQYHTVDRAAPSGIHLESDLTRSIGTAMYVAPELRSSMTGSYNDKVDMYSLGIILFEMCYPLKTFMERDRVLRSLREAEHHLPREFRKPDKVMQGDIIRTLLNHNPSDRPSSTDLLYSDRLPLKIEDETIRQALQSLSDSKSPMHKKMLAALFNQPVRQVRDYVWDMDTSTKISPNDLLLQGSVKDQLVAIFRHHGAVETSRQLLFPRSAFYRENAAQYLDSSGTLLQLPFDLTLPNARALAKRNPSAEKSFSFGHVYRDLHDGAQPRSHGEVDFDIVSYDTRDLALKEAEVIKVIDEVIDAFPSLQSSQMCFHINHSDLLDLIMEFCRIGHSLRTGVKETISKLNIQDWTWQKIRTELRTSSAGVSSTSLDDLARFDFRDTPEKAFEKLKMIFDESGMSGKLFGKTSAIFAHITALDSYLKSFNVRRKIYVSPLSSFNERFYKGGLLFQCLYDQRRRDVFAAGGRYDRLIKEHRPKAQVNIEECHAVGFNLAWEKIFISMMRFQKTTAKGFLKKTEKPDDSFRGLWATRRCDVLVASFDSTILRTEGVKIAQKLWAADISAEIACDSHSPEELLSHYREDKHNWILIIKQDTGGFGEHLLKVKNTITKDDSEIRNSELLSWLRGEMRERNHREGTNHRTDFKQTAGRNENMSRSADREPDVRVLIPSYPLKSKKNNRRNIIESAQLRTQTLVTTFLDGPIAAISVTDEILDALRSTRLSDPESWRKVVQNAPVNDRKYIISIHDLVTNMARDAKATTRNAFLYNYKTGGCIYYDLGA